MKTIIIKKDVVSDRQNNKFLFIFKSLDSTRNHDIEVVTYFKNKKTMEQALLKAKSETNQVLIDDTNVAYFRLNLNIEPKIKIKLDKK
jgi:hypothetical protein